MLDLLYKRRSARMYEEKLVEEKKINAILEAALLSPTSRNRLPWEFIVVTDKALLEKLASAKCHGSAFLNTAPLGIVVIADTAKSDVWVEDASIASTIIQMEAEDLGLSSCWIQIRKRFTDEKENSTSEDYVKNLLNIPEEFSVESIIAVGYPSVKREGHNKGELLWQKVHKNKFNDKE